MSIENQNLPERKLNVFIRALITTISPFIYTLPPLLVQLAAYKILGDSFMENETTMNIVNNILRVTVFLIAFVMVVFMTKKIDRRPLSNLRMEVNSNAAFSLLIGLIVSFISVSIMGILLVKFAPNVMIAPEPFAYRSIPMFILNVFLAAVILQGIPEEVFFRGYLPQTLETTPYKALIISTVLFGVIHLVTGPKVLPDMFFSVLQPTFFGFAAFAISYSYKSTWGGIGVHAGIHFANGLNEYLEIGYSNTLWFISALSYLVLGLIIILINREKFKEENNSIPK